MKKTNEEYVSEHIEKTNKEEEILRKELVSILVVFLSKTNHETIVSISREIRTKEYNMKNLWKKQSYMYVLVGSDHWKKVKKIVGIDTDKFDTLASVSRELKRLCGVLSCNTQYFYNAMKGNGFDLIDIIRLRRIGILPPPPDAPENTETHE